MVNYFLKFFILFIFNAVKSVVKANNNNEISKYSHQELQIASNCNVLTNAKEEGTQEFKAAETTPDKMQMLKTLFQYKIMQSQMQMQSQIPNNMTFCNIPQNTQMTQIPQINQMQNFPAINVAPQISSGFPMMAAPQMNYGIFPNTYYSQNFNNYMTASAGFPPQSTQVYMSYPAMAYQNFGYNPNSMFQ